MPRQFVICSDGTGQTYGPHKSNVARLFKLLDLDHEKKQQIGCYSPGVGTIPDQATQDEIKEAQPDQILLPQNETTKLESLKGLMVGDGLKENIHNLYSALAANYVEGDQIFMFGFSRGAFTVRALAGLLRRCGLVHPKYTDKEHFEEAYSLYEPHEEDVRAVDSFKSRCESRQIEVEFLGLWDTVKSYGYMRPVSLPHTRYNTIVKHIRHALALSESRSFYIPTTWGGLDDPPDKVRKPQHPSQTLSEVWFAGDHSDVGGGHKDAEGHSPARYSLEWMIYEATAPNIQLRIKQPAAKNEYELLLPEGSEPKAHNLLASKWYWWGLEFIPRNEFNNGGDKPEPNFKWLAFNGSRHPEEYPRDKKIRIHRSAEKVIGSERFNTLVRHCESKGTKVIIEPQTQ
jgi:uncharacterized protein (DUF2235 family)